MRFPGFLLILSAAALLAQGPPMPPDPSGPTGPPLPPSHDQLKQALGLSDDQVTQLVDLRKQEREALRPVFAQMRDKRKAVQDAMQAGGTDAAALGNLLIEMQNLRKQVRDSNLQYRDKALGVLNADQKAKLKALEEAEKLAPAIRQGVGLNLLAPPERPEGMGFGEGGPGGPGFGRPPMGAGFWMDQGGGRPLGRRGPSERSK